MNLPDPSHGFLVAALYRFCPLPNFEALRAPLAGFCCARGIKGTLLLAPEGINGTVAGCDGAVAELVEHLEEAIGLSGLELKYSRAAAMPFRRMKVRLKKEIVTMGVEDLDPAHASGTYVEPSRWNALIDDPETIVIDTRNEYEVAIGTFRGALDPATRSFREFPAWLEKRAAELKDRRVAMFCTGGIRCEKATAYARSLGLEQVFHLKGGILKYLEEVQPAESRWQGECFVFDERVALTHGLGEGEASLCRACRRPLRADDLQSPDYREGISCPYCIAEHSDADRKRFADRQRQLAGPSRRSGARPES